MKNGLLGGACALLVLALGAPAMAQDREAARAAFEEGEAHYDAARWMLAAQSFRRAYELMAGDPAAALILFNEARALEQAPGQECHARASYEQYLTEAARSSAANAQLRVDEARQRIRELDARRGGAPCDGEAGASGEGDSGTSGEAGGGGAGTISPVGPVLIGVGAAALIAGAITGGLALSAQGDLDALCGQDHVCPESASARVSELQAMAVATDVLLPVGVAVAAAGVVLTLVLRDGGDQAPASAWCTPDGCGAVVRGRF